MPNHNQNLQTPSSKKHKPDKTSTYAPNRNQRKRTWKDSEKQQQVTRTIQNNLANSENRTSTIILSGLHGNDEKDFNQPQVSICVAACKANKLFDLQIMVRHMWQSDFTVDEVANLLLNPNSSVNLEQIFIVQSINKNVVTVLNTMYEEEVKQGKKYPEIDLDMEDIENDDEKKALIAFGKIQLMKKKLNKKLQCYSTEADLILVLDDDLEQQERTYWYKINSNKYNIHDTRMPANIPIVPDNNQEPEKIKEKKLEFKLKNLAKTISHSVNSKNYEKRQQRTALKVTFIR